MSLELVNDQGQLSEPSSPEAAAKRAAERDAARAAVLAAPSLGWSSEGRTWTREELYER